MLKHCYRNYGSAIMSNLMPDRLANQVPQNNLMKVFISVHCGSLTKAPLIFHGWQSDNRGGRV